MKDAVIDYVKTCLTCQKVKNEHVYTLGLFQPLPIPEEVWCSVDIDFIIGLHK
jgi:hypothetical protein